jgi:hypothetical protein
LQCGGVGYTLLLLPALYGGNIHSSCVWVNAESVSNEKIILRAAQAGAWRTFSESRGGRAGNFPAELAEVRNGRG